MISRNGLAWLECGRLSRLPWILHAFSTRRGGVSVVPAAGLNLGFTESDRRLRVEQNRLQFFAQLGAEDFALASLRQVHSTHVYLVTRPAARGLRTAGQGGEERLEYRPCFNRFLEPGTEAHPAGDALLTDQAGILLSVRSADCLPVLIVDPERRAVAAVHAGWRGALHRVIEKAAVEMRRSFGSRPERLLAALGPSIRSCCYEVGEKVEEAFHRHFPQVERFFGPRPARQRLRRHTSTHLDLVAVARAQLRGAGLSAHHVWVAEFCTACRTDLFYSHRKEGPRTGRVMAVIGIRAGGCERLGT